MSAMENAVPSSSKQYVQLTPGEIDAALASTRCIYCGVRKAKGAAFCVSDTIALPLYLRGWLAKGDPKFLHENFRRALQHLVDVGPQRAKRYGRHGIWTLTSEDALHAAGYQQSGHARCAVPGCGARIVWYLTPRKKRLALDFPAYQPHRPNCVDPEYFQRKRELQRLQASAQRAAKKAAQGAK